MNVVDSALITSSSSDDDTPNERPRPTGSGSRARDEDPLALLATASGRVDTKRARTDRQDKPTRRSPLRSADEQKQRRLETNRLAAKRAYYRRQEKMNSMQEENERLKALIEKYEAALWSVGRDPSCVARGEPKGVEPAQVIPAEDACTGSEVAVPGGLAWGRRQPSAEPAGGDQESNSYASRVC